MDPVLRQRIGRLLELPSEIEKLTKRRVALRAERRTTELKLKRQAALVNSETLQDKEYREARTAREREILLEAALQQDDVYGELLERLDQLSTAFEKVAGELEVLDHERKALKAVLEREYAAVIERVVSDRILAEVAATQRLPRGSA